MGNEGNKRKEGDLEDEIFKQKRLIEEQEREIQKIQNESPVAQIKKRDIDSFVEATNEGDVQKIKEIFKRRTINFHDVLYDKRASVAIRKHFRSGSVENHYRIVEELVSGPKDDGEWGFTSFFYIKSLDDRYQDEIIRALVTDGFNMNRGMIEATEAGHYKLMKKLINLGADVNYKNRETGATAMHIVAKCRRIEPEIPKNELLSFLYKKGGKLDARNGLGEVVRELIDEELLNSLEGQESEEEEEKPKKRVIKDEDFLEHKPKSLHVPVASDTSAFKKLTNIFFSEIGVTPQQSSRESRDLESSESENESEDESYDEDESASEDEEEEERRKKKLSVHVYGKRNNFDDFKTKKNEDSKTEKKEREEKKIQKSNLLSVGEDKKLERTLTTNTFLKKLDNEMQEFMNVDGEDDSRLHFLAAEEAQRMKELQKIMEKGDNEDDLSSDSDSEDAKHTKTRKKIETGSEDSDEEDSEEELYFSTKKRNDINDDLSSSESNSSSSSEEEEEDDGLTDEQRREIEVRKRQMEERKRKLMRRRQRVTESKIPSIAVKLQQEEMKQKNRTKKNPMKNEEEERNRKNENENIIPEEMRHLFSPHALEKYGILKKSPRKNVEEMAAPKIIIEEESPEEKLLENIQSLIEEAKVEERKEVENNEDDEIMESFERARMSIQDTEEKIREETVRKENMKMKEIQDRIKRQEDEEMKKLISLNEFRKRRKEQMKKMGGEGGGKRGSENMKLQVDVMQETEKILQSEIKKIKQEIRKSQNYLIESISMFESHKEHLQTRKKSKSPPKIPRKDLRSKSKSPPKIRGRGRGRRVRGRGRGRSRGRGRGRGRKVRAATVPARKPGPPTVPSKSGRVSPTKKRKISKKQLRMKRSTQMPSRSIEKRKRDDSFKKIKKSERSRRVTTKPSKNNAKSEDLMMKEIMERLEAENKRIEEERKKALARLKRSKTLGGKK